MSVSNLHPPLGAPNPDVRTRSRSPGLAIAAGVLVVVTFASSWTAKQQLEQLFYELDLDQLRSGEEALNAVLEQQRARLLASVRILADDTRIRSTAMTTGFDEGTIRDVLEDLKKAADVNVLAVLDERGKVRAITGAEGLREMDLSSSPVIRAALEQPASYTWTLPEQVVLIGVAPIRVGARVSALLLMGIALDAHQLAGIERGTGVMVAMSSAERMIVKPTSNDPAAAPFLAGVFQSAGTAGDSEGRPVPGFADFLARVTRTSESATAAKLIWVVRGHAQSGHAHLVLTVVWIPVLFTTAVFGYVMLMMMRKRKGGVS
jgi:Double sensory domain of two-component sensor kinase